MKRKIVQHGPSTLTVSLPAKWVQDHGLSKGDEVMLEEIDNGLFFTTDKNKSLGTKRVNVKGMNTIVPHVITALYKRGHDDIIIDYDNLAEVEMIYDTLNKSCIGFEIIEEKPGSVRIKKVSEPSQQEFKTLFRRIFFFLLSIAKEGVEAATKNDTEAFKKLLLRDENINKLSDFCRRVVNKRGQTEYKSDTLLYYVIEQLEKIGDDYGAINYHLIETPKKLHEVTLTLYEEVNELLREYEQLFFKFDVTKVDEFMRACKKLLSKIEKNPPSTNDAFVCFRLESVLLKLHDLVGATLALNL